MNYIELINNFWRTNDEKSIGTVAGMLYFHLLDISNKQNWRNPFNRQNTKICADLGITNPTLLKARNELKQRGLIEFFSKGKGDTNVKYEINNVKFLHSSFHTPLHSSLHTSYDLSKTKTETCEVVEYDALFDFFKTTKNYRIAKEKHRLSEHDLIDTFQHFYESKVDVGEFKNRTKEDIVKHFGFWLPSYLSIQKNQQKQESVVGERGIVASLEWGNVKMRG